MFGLPPFLGLGPKKPREMEQSWGHLTCGGTISNCEAFWAARNCRFLALSIRKYIENLPNKNSEIHEIEVTLCTGEKKKLLDLNGWEILNISNEETMKLYDLGFSTLYGEDITNPENK